MAFTANCPLYPLSPVRQLCELFHIGQSFEFEIHLPLQCTLHHWTIQKHKMVQLIGLLLLVDHLHCILLLRSCDCYNITIPKHFSHSIICIINNEEFTIGQEDRTRLPQQYFLHEQHHQQQRSTVGPLF